MRHYEIVLIVHPDQSEQVDGMVNRYRASIEREGGKVHRYEDWGRRQLAYPIAKVHKAHYVLLNIETSQEGLAELESAFRFNDAILRNMILIRKEPKTGESPIYLETKAQQAAEKDRERRREEELRSRQRERVEDAQASREVADEENGETDTPAATVDADTTEPAVAEQTESDAEESEVVEAAVTEPEASAVASEETVAAATDSGVEESAETATVDDSEPAVDDPATEEAAPAEETTSEAPAEDETAAETPTSEQEKKE